MLSLNFWGLCTVVFIILHIGTAHGDDDCKNLYIVNTTPSNLLNGIESLQISREQGITIEFSRAVIQEEDVNKYAPSIPTNQMPFHFDKPIQGQFRWLTCNTFRYDPQHLWPTDMELNLVFNNTLTTYDNITLNTTNIIHPQITLTTQSLKFEIVDVHSKMANQLSDNNWAPYTSLSDPRKQRKKQQPACFGEPEVPPDGQIILIFNFPVDLNFLNQYFIVKKEGVQTDIQTLVYSCSLEEKTKYGEFCAKVELLGDLEVGQKYELVLPKNSKYNNNILSHPLRQDISRIFYGLKQFQIPIKLEQVVVRDEDYYYSEQTISGVFARRFNLFLMHGLHQNTSLTDFKKCIVIEEIVNNNSTSQTKLIPIDFELNQINKGNVRLTAPFQPLKQYKITIETQENINIMDGFGLPIKTPKILSSKLQQYDDYYYDYGNDNSLDDNQEILQSCQENNNNTNTNKKYYIEDEIGENYIIFTMQHEQQIFSTLSMDDSIEPLFEDIQNMKYEWPLFSKNSNDRLSVWAVTEENLLNAMTITMLHPYSYPDKTDVLGEPDSIFYGQKNSSDLQITDINPTELLSKTGSFITQICQYSKYSQDQKCYPQHPKIVKKTKFNFAYIFADDKSVLFVTDLQTGLPMKNISVKIYAMDTANYPQRWKLLCEDYTNNDGLVIWDYNVLRGDGENRIIVLKEQNRLIYFEEIAYYNNNRNFQKYYRNQVQQFQDKKLVRPGDTLKIRGYIGDQQGQKLNLKAETFSVSISPEFVKDRNQNFGHRGYQYNNIYAEEQQQYIVQYDNEFGSFSVDIPVPPNAEQQKYRVEISPSRRYEYDMYYFEFVVGDPKPTQATLNVQVPDKISLTENLLVQIDANTQGQQSKINITYGKFKQYRYDDKFYTEQINTDSITTNTNGRAQYQIDIVPEFTFPDKYMQYDSIYIDFEWIAPTNEYLTLRKIIPLTKDLFEFKFRTSIQTDVPGIEFRFFLDEIEDNQNILIYVMEYSEREIELYGKPSLNWRQFIFESSWYGLQEQHVIFSTEQQQYQASEGVSYKFPKIGKFLMAACAKKDKKQICHGMFGGMSKTEWEKNPLQEHNLIGHTLDYNKEDLSQFQLQIDTPYENVQALVFWENENYTDFSVVPLQSGFQKIQVPVGEEFTSDFHVRATFLVPRQDMSRVQPIPVPTTKLFDPSVPHEEWGDFGRIQFPKLINNIIQVQIQPEKQMLMLGENTTLDIIVHKCAQGGMKCQPAVDSEVTVVILDKIGLEIQPYSAEFPSEFNEFQKSSSNVIYNSWSKNGRKILPFQSPHLVSQFIKQVNLADPMVPLDYFVFPKEYSGIEALDGSVEDYLNTYVSPLTTYKYDYYWNEINKSKKPVFNIQNIDKNNWEEDTFSTILFETVRTNADGRAKVQFSVPNREGKFVVRAYASNKDFLFDQAEIELVVDTSIANLQSDNLYILHE